MHHSPNQMVTMTSTSDEDCSEFMEEEFQLKFGEGSLGMKFHSDADAGTFVVISCKEDSAATKLGVRAGDIILQIASTRIDSNFHGEHTMASVGDLIRCSLRPIRLLFARSGPADESYQAWVDDKQRQKEKRLAAKKKEAKRAKRMNVEQAPENENEDATNAEAQDPVERERAETAVEEKQAQKAKAKQQAKKMDKKTDKKAKKVKPRSGFIVKYDLTAGALGLAFKDPVPKKQSTGEKEQQVAVRVVGVSGTSEAAGVRVGDILVAVGTANKLELVSGPVSKCAHTKKSIIQLVQAHAENVKQKVAAGGALGDADALVIEFRRKKAKKTELQCDLQGDAQSSAKLQIQEVCEQQQQEVEQAEAEQQEEQREEKEKEEEAEAEQQEQQQEEEEDDKGAKTEAKQQEQKQEMSDLGEEEREETQEQEGGEHGENVKQEQENDGQNVAIDCEADQVFDCPSEEDTGEDDDGDGGEREGLDGVHGKEVEAHQPPTPPAPRPEEDVGSKHSYCSRRAHVLALGREAAALHAQAEDVRSAILSELVRLGVQESVVRAKLESATQHPAGAKGKLRDYSALHSAHVHAAAAHRAAEQGLGAEEWQRRWRGARTRAWVRELRTARRADAARLVQRVLRGGRSRQAVRATRLDAEQEELREVLHAAQREAAVQVQAITRGRGARRLYRRERACRALQRDIRGLLGRRRAAAKRAAICDAACGVIQRTARGRLGWKVAMARREARRRQLFEAAAALQRRARGMIERAQVRKMRRVRDAAASVTLQRWARGVAGRRLVSSMRTALLEARASSRLQAFARGTMVRRILRRQKAATNLQRVLYHGVRARREAWRARVERHADLILKRVARGMLARRQARRLVEARERRRQAAATDLQRVLVRGTRGRRLAAQKRAHRCQCALTMQLAIRGWLLRKRRARAYAALTLQRVHRGAKGRRAWQAEKRARLLARQRLERVSALRIQSAARGAAGRGCARARRTEVRRRGAGVRLQSLARGRRARGQTHLLRVERARVEAVQARNAMREVERGVMQVAESMGLETETAVEQIDEAKARVWAQYTMHLSRRVQGSNGSAKATLESLLGGRLTGTGTGTDSGSGSLDTLSRLGASATLSRLADQRFAALTVAPREAVARWCQRRRRGCICRGAARVRREARQEHEALLERASMQGMHWRQLRVAEEAERRKKKEEQGNDHDHEQQLEQEQQQEEQEQQQQAAPTPVLIPAATVSNETADKVPTAKGKQLVHDGSRMKSSKSKKKSKASSSSIKASGVATDQGRKYTVSYFGVGSVGITFNGYPKDGSFRVISVAKDGASAAAGVRVGEELVALGCRGLPMVAVAGMGKKQIVSKIKEHMACNMVEAGAGHGGDGAEASHPLCISFKRLFAHRRTKTNQCRMTGEPMTGLVVEAAAEETNKAELEIVYVSAQTAQLLPRHQTTQLPKSIAGNESTAPEVEDEEQVEGVDQEKEEKETKPEVKEEGGEEKEEKEEEEEDEDGDEGDDEEEDDEEDEDEKDTDTREATPSAHFMTGRSKGSAPTPARARKPSDEPAAAAEHLRIPSAVVGEEEEVERAEEEILCGYPARRVRCVSYSIQDLALGLRFGMRKNGTMKVTEVSGTSAQKGVRKGETILQVGDTILGTGKFTDKMVVALFKTSPRPLEVKFKKRAKHNSSIHL